MRSMSIGLLFCSLWMTNVWAADSCWDSTRGHCYPRTGMFIWGTPPVEWFAKFEHVFSRPTDIEYVKSVKALNPNQYYLFIEDWNCATGLSLEDDQMAHNTAGGIYNDYCSSGAANMSTLYPSGTVSPKVCDIYYNTLMQRAQYFTGDYALLAGFGTDGFYNGDLAFNYLMDHEGDLDRDGISDYNATGIGAWNEGADRHVANLRVAMGSDRILMINTGGWHGHEWKSVTNGMLLENFVETANSWRYDRSQYDTWMSEAKEPNFVDFDGMIENKNDFQGARFMLGMVLYGSGYISISDQPFNLHFHNSVYDEFDLNLGWPTTKMDYIPGMIFDTGDYTDWGVYIRFFDYGAVIVNVSDHDVVVSVSDIVNINGYDGPYYRFRGGQDPSHNNGQPFDSVTLKGRSCGTDCATGDSIILTKMPTTMVTDIYLDSDDDGVSPGSQVTYEGSWTATCDDIADQWSIACREIDGWGGYYYYGLSYASPGSANRAIFDPAIGVAGEYEVYEWHGRVTNQTVATNVAYAINHAVGTDRLTVNQQLGQGQWNLLGKYTFNPTSASEIVIEAEGANGTVIADAIKLVFMGNEGNIKGDISPRAPINLRIGGN